MFAFDFDGTLTSIVTKPEDVLFGEDLRQALCLAAKKFNVLVCSGRALRDLEVYVPKCSGLDLIGNHGLEWRLRRRDSDRAPLREESRILSPPGWDEWRLMALEQLSQICIENGGEVEDKRASLTIHFRTRGTNWWQSEEAKARLAGLAGNTVRILAGKFSWNLLPAGFSKGEAIQRYAREFGYDSLIYFGDEQTDETVFAYHELCRWGVKIGEGPTEARYRLSRVEEAQTWLRQLSILDNGLM